DQRRERRREAVGRDLVDGLGDAGPALQQRSVALGVVRERSALHGLDDAGIHAAGVERERQRRGDDGLADAGVGAGDEEPVHAPVTPAIDSWRIASIAARSSGSLASGGRNVTT